MLKMILCAVVLLMGIALSSGKEKEHDHDRTSRLTAPGFYPIPPPPPGLPVAVMGPPPTCPPQHVRDTGMVHAMPSNVINIWPHCGTTKHGTKRNILEFLKEDPQISKRVVGGGLSPEGAWPWTVSLIRGNRHWCGGSLIGDRWVLTAAHCLQDSDWEYPCTIRVQIGENTILGLSPDRQVYAADRIIKHGLYNVGSQFANDIALIRLSRRVRLGGDANTICLPAMNEIYNLNSCTIIEWGKVSHAQSPNTQTNHLLHLQIGQMPTPVCSMKLGRPIPPGEICINTYPGRDACNGDSGGPMVCKSLTGRWVLIGVTSYGTAGPLCGLTDRPTIYSNVVFYRPWIENVVSRNGGY